MACQSQSDYLLEGVPMNELIFPPSFCSVKRMTHNKAAKNER